MVIKMGKKYPKFSVEFAGRIWRFDARIYCGYILCHRLRKAFPISKIARTNDGGWVCSCGKYTTDDEYYHNVKYGVEADE